MILTALISHEFMSEKVTPGHISGSITFIKMSEDKFIPMACNVYVIFMRMPLNSSQNSRLHSINIQIIFKPALQFTLSFVA